MPTVDKLRYVVRKGMISPIRDKSNWVDGRSIASTAAEIIPIPTDAKIVFLKSSAAFNVNLASGITVAAVITDITAGTGSIFCAANEEHAFGLGDAAGINILNLAGPTILVSAEFYK